MSQNDFISEFENENFNFCGINWWPIIKVQVAYKLHLLSINKTDFKVDKQDVNKSFERISFLERLRYFYQFLKRPNEIKNLIITDSCHKTISQIGIDDIKNPYTDPFIFYLKKLKLPYTVFDYKLLDFTLGFNLKILNKFHKKQAKKKFDNSKKFQSKLNDFCNYLKVQYGDDFNINFHIVHTILNTQAEYLTFSFIFKKLSVKNVLLYCYYNNTIMSVIRASNNLNIKTIEYQHSQVTSNHFAYSKWSHNINNSRDFFPSKIWVWRKEDANYLKEQFKKIKNIDFIVGGNLLLSLIQVKKDKRIDGKIKILVTLQGIDLPEYIYGILENNSSVIFYLRLHPRYPFDKELCEQLKLKYPNEIELEKANSLNLHELFNHVDYHLTCFSGSAIEATHFNLTNIIYGDKGYLTFKNEITNGEFLFIKNLKEFEYILCNRIKAKSRVSNSKININQILKNNFS